MKDIIRQGHHEVKVKRREEWINKYSIVIDAIITITAIILALVILYIKLNKG